MTMANVITSVYGSLFYIGLFFITALLVKTVAFFANRKKNIELFQKIGIPCTDTDIWKGNFDKFKGKVIHEELMRMSEDLGPLYAYFLADQACVVISDPKLAQQLLLKHQKNLLSRINLPIAANPIDASILFSSGAKWKRQRKLIQPIFSRYRIEEKEAAAHLDTTMDGMLDYLDKKQHLQDKKDEGFDITIHQLMKSATYNMIGSMALNMNDLTIGENEPHIKLLDSYTNIMGSHDGLVEWVIRLPLLATIINFVIKYITAGPFISKLINSVNDRIDNSNSNDDYHDGDSSEQLHQFAEVEKEQKRVPLLDALIKLHKDGTLSRTEVQGNALAILVAGYDTSSTTLAYLFWLIANDQHIQTRLYNDIIREGSAATYLEAVIYETLRMFTPSPLFVTRYLEEPITLDTTEIFSDNKLPTVTLPIGTTVILNSMSIHFNPKLWHEPNKFNPDRFLDRTNQDSLAKLPEFFNPFGYGLRKCPGQSLAMTEMKMIATNILSKYHLKLGHPKELSMVTHATFLSKPKDAIILKFYPRY